MAGVEDILGLSFTQNAKQSAHGRELSPPSSTQETEECSTILHQKQTSLQQVYLIFEGNVESDASTFYDVKIDSENDATINVSLTQEMLNDKKIWLKFNTDPYKRIRNSDVGIDKHGDIMIRFKPTPQQASSISKLPVSSFIEWVPGQHSLSSYIGKYTFQRGVLLVCCDIDKWRPVSFQYDDGLVDGNFYFLV